MGKFLVGIALIVIGVVAIGRDGSLAAGIVLIVIGLGLVVASFR